MTNKTLIIAEAGVNHNGDINLAKKLIDVAVSAGADLVKFQTFKADQLVTQTIDQAKYQAANTGTGETQYQMLKRLELSEAQHRELINYCNVRGIGFFSTAFDIESLEFLISLDQKIFKIPSGEITNYPYLVSIGKLGSQVIMSTGMATLSEIEAAIGVLEEAGTPRSKLTVLHCTTAYPTPIEEVNLKAMKTIGSLFGVEVGYSDHTLGIEVSVAAVALGATTIEKHFTLNRNLPGPDHKASLEPDELKQLVSSIRNIERALGDGIKKPTASELINRLPARKVIVAKCDIAKGELFTELNLSTKRAGDGLSPMRWKEVIGNKASKSFIANELISI